MLARVRTIEIGAHTLFIVKEREKKEGGRETERE
jgi:hypothetical protein